MRVIIILELAQLHVRPAQSREHGAGPDKSADLSSMCLPCSVRQSKADTDSGTGNECWLMLHPWSAWPLLGTYAHLLDDGLCAARLAVDQLLDHLGRAHDAILAPSHDDLARLALWEVLVHDDVCLAGLL